MSNVRYSGDMSFTSFTTSGPEPRRGINSADVTRNGSDSGIAVAEGAAAASTPAVAVAALYGQPQRSYYMPTGNSSALGHSSTQNATYWQQQQQQQALYAQADPQTQLTQESQMHPSESGGSLVQYSQSHGSLLMAGPGSLCAALPRYVRHPPIEAVVFGWGVSEDGQLGIADCRGDVVAPKVVEALLGVPFSGRGFSRTPLVAGSRNTMAIDAAGQVWSFGWNDRGTLGHGHRDVERKPKRIAALKGIRVVQVAIGGWHCLALSDRGTMFAWGGNEYGQCGGMVPGQRDIVDPLPVDRGLGPNQRVRQVSAGGMHSLALLEDGTVWQWGENWGDFSMHPVRTPRPVPGAVAVAAVSCGAFHNLLLTAGGRVLSWGMNDYGQLGNGSTTYSTAPRPVLDMDGVVVADIAAGGWHSCALSSAGEVWVWGRGEYGRLGLGDRSGSSKLRPQKVRGLESHVVVQVVAGGSHTLALTSSARLFVWGRGAFGRLGLGLADGDRDCYHPVECNLPGGPERWRVAAIGAGGRHSICLAIPLRDPVASGSEGLIGEAPLPPPDLTNHHDLHHRRSSEEYDVDGYSEPSLYDKDVSYDQALPEAASPLRHRRQAVVTADGSIAAAATGFTAAGAAAGAAAGSPGDLQRREAPAPPPDLRPQMQSTLTDWPSIDSAGGVPSAGASAAYGPVPVPMVPVVPMPLPPLRPAAALPPLPSNAPTAGAASFAAAAGSSGGGAASDTPSASDSPSRGPAQPLSPLPPPPPQPSSYSMRRSGSSIGPLSQLSQLLPGPAAVAAAAVLDADSDLAPPRGLAGAALSVAAAVAAAAGASRPSSAQGSVGNGNGSRGGSVTGMARFRTVFGGGGEEEDEATQAAEAAEAAAENDVGSGAGDDELGLDADDAHDDMDEDQGLYEGSGPQHPRSPSIMSRPRSPPLPLSPRHHPPFGAGGSASANARAPSPSMMNAASGGLGAMAPTGSPSSRALLAASYGSPRVPSAVQPQQYPPQTQG